MPASTRKLPMRLAFREEGHFWNCYMAKQDTMEGAKLIGCIAMGAVRKSADIKADFMDVMKAAFALAASEVTGVKVEWPSTPESAPESERGGNA